MNKSSDSIHISDDHRIENAQQPYTIDKLLHGLVINNPKRMVGKGSQAAYRHLNDTLIGLFHFAPPHGRKKAPNYFLDSWTLSIK